MARTVMCSKLGREAPGLSAPPFSGPLGEKIFERVSMQAWQSWQEDMMIKIINEYRLDMTNDNDYQKLLDQMSAFLNLQQGEVLEVENAERGKGN